MCDRTGFQALLPQEVLVSANQVSEERLARIRMAAPACVRIWKYTKAWMPSVVMVRYMRLPGMCRHGYRQARRFILHVDVLQAHICPAGLRAESVANIWMCLGPATATRESQPCDTHSFGRAKQMLTAKLHGGNGLTSLGESSWELMLESLWHVV